MGYTHYWYQKPSLNQKKFNVFAEVIGKLLSTDEAKELLAYEHDSTSQLPHVSNQEVRFNGKGEDGHETFLFKRNAAVADYQEDKSIAFNFCKTAAKPYDKYVVACLIIAKSIFEKDVKISSDGDIEDWEEGRVLAEQFLNSKVTLTFPDGGDIQVESVVSQTSIEDFVKDISK